MALRNLKNFLRKKLWHLTKATWKLKSGITVKVEDDSDWFVYNEIFVNREYDIAIDHFLFNKASRPLIVDLGANVGYFTLKLADELYINHVTDFEIICVEANAENYSSLLKRIEQPHIKNKIKVFYGLAGFKTGQGQMIHSDQHYGHSSLEASKGIHKTVAVDYLNIENLILPSGRTIDFMKCDIEGSEEVFIKEYGDLIARTQILVIEWHAKACNIVAAKKLLTNYGLNSLGILKEEHIYETSVELFTRTIRNSQA